MAASKAPSPIDQWLRPYLRSLITGRPDLTQTMLAQDIGRSPGWLNKYINGAGQATIDDLMRLAYVLCNLLPYEDLTRPLEVLIRTARADRLAAAPTVQKGAER